MDTILWYGYNGMIPCMNPIDGSSLVNLIKESSGIDPVDESSGMNPIDG